MNRLRLKVLAYAAVACMIAGGLSSCATGRINIPADLSPAEIIQRAQEASDRNRYNVALQYYETLLERNSHDLVLVCAAEYEIAFIYYKQRKYPLSREKFNALLDRYDEPDGESLPQQFRILTTIVLGQIDEKESVRRPFSRR